jgi:mRNA-degrading endonuclease RelE of RelBE toxin-antitoxin system
MGQSPFDVLLVTSAIADLRSVPVHARRRIVDAVNEQLSTAPQVQTRNRKPLPGLAPNWEHCPPVWELRVGDYRVFYDVDEVEQSVVVRAVRLKRPGTTTREIV